RTATRRPTQDFVLGRIRRREWRAREHAPPPCRGRQSRRDSLGTPGARTGPASRGRPPLQSAGCVVQTSFAAPASLAAAWRSHVPPYESCSPSSPTQDAVLGRPTRPLERLGSTGDPHLDVATRPSR